MSVLEISGHRITCEIKRRGVRHIYLKLKPGFRLEVILPRHSGISAAGILEKKRPWIEKKVKEISKAKKIFDGDTIFYKGEPRKVRVYPAKKPRKQVRLYKNVIHVYENSGKRRDKLLIDFITGQTICYVEEKARKVSNELGLFYNSIGTKEMKKWGYCTKNGGLFFNWRLICLPERLADYIIFHEILHLKHFNHSKRFKKDLTRCFGDHKEAETMLKNYLLAE